MLFNVNVKLKVLKLNRIAQHHDGVDGKWVFRTCCVVGHICKSGHSGKIACVVTFFVYIIILLSFGHRGTD